MNDVFFYMLIAPINLFSVPIINSINSHALSVIFLGKSQQVHLIVNSVQMYGDPISKTTANDMRENWTFVNINEHRVMWIRTVAYGVYG